MTHKNRLWKRKLKLNIAGVAMLISFFFFTTSAQTMYVSQSDDSQSTFALNNLRKLTFTSGNVNVHKKDNSLGVFALNEVNYLSFSDYTTSIERVNQQVNMEHLIVYPNPVKEVLTIQLTASENENGNIHLLSIDGKILQVHETRGDSTVRLFMKDLSNGIYICRYNNGSVVKTVKVIKH